MSIIQWKYPDAAAEHDHGLADVLGRRPGKEAKTPAPGGMKRCRC